MSGAVPRQMALYHIKARARERVSREAMFLHGSYLQVPILSSCSSFLS